MLGGKRPDNYEQSTIYSPPDRLPFGKHGIGPERMKINIIQNNMQLEPQMKKISLS